VSGLVEVLARLEIEATAVIPDSFRTEGKP